jgi:hypothetical protein
MINLYVATRVITFPGTVLRAFWEHLICRLCSIPAEDIRAFKVSELCGHVEHELVKKKSHSFLMCFVPFLLNFLLACCFFLGGSYRIAYIGDLKSVLAWVYLWLGISFATNCVPSFEDILSFKDIFFDKATKTIVKIVVAPFYALIYGFSILERFGLTFVISILFSIVFPQIFNKLFPAIIFLIQSFQS